MTKQPGCIRIRGQHDAMLVANDLKIEVQQTDGVWIPLHCVSSLSLTVEAGEAVNAHLVVSVAALDLSDVAVKSLGWLNERSRWQRLVAWVCGR